MKHFDPDSFVKNGATFLDDYFPGWSGKIDVQNLDIEYDCDCMLGQLTGSYNRTVKALDMGPREATTLGFFTTATDLGVRQSHFRQLTSAWKSEIAARRERELIHA